MSLGELFNSTDIASDTSESRRRQGDFVESVTLSLIALPLVIGEVFVDVYDFARYQLSGGRI